MAELQTTLVESLEGDADQAVTTEGDNTSTKRSATERLKGSEAKESTLKAEGDSGSEEDKRRKAALDKLGNASKDSFLGHVSSSYPPLMLCC